jgi:hypothetical protein
MLLVIVVRPTDTTIRQSVGLTGNTPYVFLDRAKKEIQTLSGALVAVVNRDDEAITQFRRLLETSNLQPDEIVMLVHFDGNQPYRDWDGLAGLLGQDLLTARSVDMSSHGNDPVYTSVCALAGASDRFGDMARALTAQASQVLAQPTAKGGFEGACQRNQALARRITGYAATLGPPENSRDSPASEGEPAPLDAASEILHEMNSSFATLFTSLANYNDGIWTWREACDNCHGSVSVLLELGAILLGEGSSSWLESKGLQSFVKYSRAVAEEVRQSLSDSRWSGLKQLLAEMNSASSAGPSTPLKVEEFREWWQVLNQRLLGRRG